MDWLRRLFAPSPDPIPRLGAGNLTYFGGSRALRDQFGPPHVCDVPPVAAAKFLGADYGAMWRCDCGKEWRLVFNQKSGTDEFVPYVSVLHEAGHPGEIKV